MTFSWMNSCNAPLTTSTLRTIRAVAEKLERMHRDCDSMFAADEKEFAEECFSLLLDVSDTRNATSIKRGCATA